MILMVFASCLLFPFISKSSPFLQESILESFGDDRSPDASPGSFWDEPTPRFDLSPASRRTSKESRRRLKFGMVGYGGILEI